MAGKEPAWPKEIRDLNNEAGIARQELMSAEDVRDDILERLEEAREQGDECEIDDLEDELRTIVEEIEEAQEEVDRLGSMVERKLEAWRASPEYKKG